MPRVKATKPILYVCPYCKRGRFTEDDGYDGAVKHIKENHAQGGTKRHRRKESTFNDMFLDSVPVGYNEFESLMAG
jgi:hypothetical protein